MQPPEGYVLNLQQAALTNCTNSNGSMVVKVKTISVEGEDNEAVLCTLRTPSAEQTNLNLVFGFDVPATFTVSGDAKGTVYLSGYYQPAPDLDDEDDEENYGACFNGDEEDDDEEMDEEDMVRQAQERIEQLGNGKKQLVVKGNAPKSNRVKQLKEGSEEEEESSDEEEEDDDEDNDEEDDAADEAFIKKMIARNQGGGDDDSSDEDSDDEDDSDDEPPVKVHKGATPKGVVTANGQKNQKKHQQQTVKTPQSKGHNQHNQKSGQKNGQKNTQKSGDKRKR